jgi:hypothetical protein
MIRTDPLRVAALACALVSAKLPIFRLYSSPSSHTFQTQNPGKEFARSVVLNPADKLGPLPLMRYRSRYSEALGS